MRFEQDVGSPSNQRVLTITSTPQLVTILGPKFKTLELYNAGPSTVYFGDSTVTSATGMPFFSGDNRFFKGAQNAFQIWLVCASGQTATVNAVEFP
jgi:hypothetical protein